MLGRTKNKREATDKLIFIGGIHGVGKTFFCRDLSKNLNIPHYSSSALISGEKQVQFDSTKKVKQIANNQNYLFDALNRLNLQDHEFLLDGHFCLLNQDGEITRIPEDTFVRLSPNKIIVLTDSPKVIASRLNKRDKKSYDLQFLEKFQQEEIKYGKDISQRLFVPFHLFESNNFEGNLDLLLSTK